MNLLLFLVQFISTVPITAVLVFVLLKLVARFRRSGEAGLGRAVLVTGCDSGFGHRLAGALDRGGFVVFAGCLSPDGDGAQSLVRDGSGNLKVLQLDVTKEEEVQQARKTVQENLPEEGEGHEEEGRLYGTPLRTKNRVQKHFFFQIYLNGLLFCGFAMLDFFKKKFFIYLLESNFKYI